MDNDPEFFSGQALFPQVLARGLLVLADVTSTRYFNYTPVDMRDPVLSAQGDRLRAECFSACNGVYARLDLLRSGFEGHIRRGTTNVDIGLELRAALAQVRQEDKLKVAVGEGLTAVRVSTDFSSGGSNVVRMDKAHERPVRMPDRWVRALGNSAEIHRAMQPAFSLKGAQVQMFIASLPSATGKNQAGWLTFSPTGVKLLTRRSPDAVYVSGLHRLSALKRVMTNLSGVTFYKPAEGEPGPVMMQGELPGARLTFSLTAEAWQGYSGEGALLSSLARQDVLEDAESIGSVLEFDPVIDERGMAQSWNKSENQVQAALALLAVSGKLGFDAHEGAYFHRELPEDPGRVLKDNPRLAGARKLTEAVEETGENQWTVRSNEEDYRVSFDPEKGTQEAKCTCTWYLKHLNRRGPCKHILAVQLKAEKC
jgi:hypothetical protein